MFWNVAGDTTLGLYRAIRWDWMPVLLLGSLLGGYWATHLAIRQGNRWVKHAFELVTY